jgi:hypothetical protein
MEESLSHNMGYTPGIFNNIFRWHFVLEKQRSPKHTHKTKDKITRTLLRPGG